MKTIKNKDRTNRFARRVVDIAIDQAESTKMLAISLITITAYVICVIMRVCNNEVVNDYHGYGEY